MRPMKASQSKRRMLERAFVIAGETTEAGRPCKGAFDRPTPWQEDKAAFGFRYLDDDQADSCSFGSGGLN